MTKELNLTIIIHYLQNDLFIEELKGKLLEVKNCYDKIEQKAIKEESFTEGEIDLIIYQRFKEAKSFTTNNAAAADRIIIAKSNNSIFQHFQ